jgi:sensor histidine kinase YesM
MVLNSIRRSAVVLAAWLPFFAIWVSFAMSLSQEKFSTVLIGSLISMGSAGVIGIVVWHICKRWPWPLKFELKFYLSQICFAAVYGIVWTAAIYNLDMLRSGGATQAFWTRAALGRDVFMGFWFYAIFAGISYTVQTRNRLHEKEVLASAARLDALRSRLNPHFLFNALHTLSALVKFRPAMAEGAIERLGDMLRYTLKEDGREFVEFSEEYDFTREYLAFEQLRFEERLKVEMQIDPESFNFDILPFSMQTLAEDAVRHAISVRPEGGSIWIRSSCDNGKLTLTVRDDGPGSPSEGDGGPSHQFGLRSLRERLRAAYGPSAGLRVNSGPEGFEASFDIPAGSGNNE